MFNEDIDRSPAEGVTGKRDVWLIFFFMQGSILSRVLTASSSFLCFFSPQCINPLISTFLVYVFWLNRFKVSSLFLLLHLYECKHACILMINISFSFFRVYYTFLLWINLSCSYSYQLTLMTVHRLIWKKWSLWFLPRSNTASLCFFIAYNWNDMMNIFYISDYFLSPKAYYKDSFTEMSCTARTF